MNSRERIMSCLNGTSPDHLPLTTWCFGLKPPASLTWTTQGEPVRYWYSKRMEHIHTLPHEWSLDDEFKRVLAWQSLGVDDLVDVSVPWSIDPEVTWTDTVSPPDIKGGYPVMERKYSTPSGHLRHVVNRTGEDTGAGWVKQPDKVYLIEDYNIPRGREHAVSTPADIPLIKHLFRTPDTQAAQWFEERMNQIAPFAAKHGVAVQAWPAFGMDGVIWLTGVENAVIMAMEEPQDFGALVDIVAEVDYGRTYLACMHPAVDIIVQRGWYSSTDFWSPGLFNEFVVPHVRELAKLVHRNGKKFGYVMTTGVKHTRRTSCRCRG